MHSENYLIYHAIAGSHYKTLRINNFNKVISSTFLNQSWHFIYGKKPIQLTPLLFIMEDIKNIIESLLFVIEEPLTIERIKKVLNSADSNAIRKVMNELSSEYEARKGGFFLREVAGGYQIRTRPEYSQWIRRLLRPNPLRLSNAALETLAIVAYKQPVIRSDIEHLRGVDCGGILRMLLERKLIRIVGRKEIPGRPMLYTTTKKFLEVFELKDLKDLPSPKEIEDLGDSSSELLALTASDLMEQAADEDTKNS